MADLHPTELGDAFQEGSALRVAHETRPVESHSTEPCTAESCPAKLCSGSTRPRQSPALTKDFFHLLQPKRLRANMRRLRHVTQDLRRVECLFNAYMADQPLRNAEEKLQRAPQPPRIPPLPPEGGEYRLYYVSPVGLRLEQEFLQSYNARGLKDLLHLSSSILHSYSGLIHNSGVGPSEMDGVLASMADVLQVALNAVNSAEQLCMILEPVDLSTL